MTQSNTPQVKIVNVETGEEIIRDANAEELAEIESRRSQSESEQAEAEAKATARQEILDRLGLTADEAALLLG
jgi:hypothetical protein